MLLARSGLEKIRHEATAEVVSGSSVWARWWQQTLEAIREWEQAHDDMTEMRDRDYRPLIARLSDASCWVLNALMHTCSGQRPAHI